MDAYALTDVGQVRSMNQDSIFSSTEPIGSLQNLFLVADGMGGHKAGDFASRFVIEKLVEFFSHEYPERDVHGILKEGIRTVNRALFEAAVKIRICLEPEAPWWQLPSREMFFMWQILVTAACIFCGSS